jgi:hypothetical protein
MNTVRVQFELSPQKLKEIESLMRECGIETKKEFFNNAITLFKWALTQAKNGNVIASVDEAHQKYRELHMPVFDLQDNQSFEENHASPS